MAKSRRKATRSGATDRGRTRWIISLSALGLAILALYVLMSGGLGGTGWPDAAADRAGPALDEIDAESREAMRDLLRDSDD